MVLLHKKNNHLIKNLLYELNLLTIYCYAIQLTPTQYEDKQKFINFQTIN
jgi:hypothetical protein